MQTSHPPDLRVVPVSQIYAHEEHDMQRALPLIEKLRQAPLFTNPPVVAPLDDDTFVIMDGANRHFSFIQLGYEHLLVQVASYATGQVELDVWQHVISNWTEEALFDNLRALNNVEIREGQDKHAIAHLAVRSGQIYALYSPVETIHERNAALCDFVSVYQRNARLDRTEFSEPAQVWAGFPNGVAMVFFPHFQPIDIMEAARQKSFLPPGVSRHLIHGRAVRLNFPFDVLRSKQMSIEDKNAVLGDWIQYKRELRQVRYYAESLYLFDE